MCLLTLQNYNAMKQILLLIIFTLVTLTGFSQLRENRLGQQNNASREIHQSVDLKVYPNPCTGQKLTIETGNEELTEIRISNITGKVILLKRVIVPLNKIEISLDNTPNGIYLIQAKTSSNKLVAKKLIVSAN